MDANEIAKLLSESGLKVTPQRMAVLDALLNTLHHPTADEIYRMVAATIPGLSVTTVYNILDAFVENGLVHRIKTDADVMRYDAIVKPHHHLYCAETDRIEDYFDPELDQLLKDYFDRKKPGGFEISDIRLQITGNFKLN
jgi:Fur family peroxide stress response transcriptional regulator